MACDCPHISNGVPDPASLANNWKTLRPFIADSSRVDGIAYEAWRLDPSDLPANVTAFEWELRIVAYAFPTPVAPIAPLPYSSRMRVNGSRLSDGTLSGSVGVNTISISNFSLPGLVIPAYTYGDAPGGYMAVNITRFDGVLPQPWYWIFAAYSRIFVNDVPEVAP